MDLTALWLRINQLRREFFLLVLLYLTYAFFVPHVMHPFDSFCWNSWSKQVLHGVSNAYKGWTEYPPGFQYFLYLFARFEGSEQFIDRYLYQIKYFSLLFDFAGAYLVYRLVRRHVTDTYVMWFLLFNVGYMYNTMVWGQVDAVFSAFVFAAAMAGLSERVHLSVFLYIIGLSIKAQAIVFLPPLGILWLLGIQRNFKWMDYPTLATVIVVTVGAILFPFRHDLDALAKAMTGSVDRYPVISMEAYNLWHLIGIKGNLMQTPDATKFAGLSYKNWGLLMFCTVSGIAMLPLAWGILQNLLGRTTRMVGKTDFTLTAAVVALAFFFFNTQMHERYSHPALLFTAAYCFLTARYVPFILLSLTYFLSLERILHYMDLPKYGTLIFDTRFIAGVYLTTILLLLWDIAKLWRNTDWKLKEVA